MDRAERRVQNEIVFRDANERIEQSARQLAVGDPVPVICECGEESCRDLIYISAAEYEQVRSHASRFLVVRGHDNPDDEEIVDAGERHVVVEKTGPAEALAAKADPRRRG
jgi:hypothetical protein